MVLPHGHGLKPPLHQHHSFIRIEQIGLSSFHSSWEFVWAVSLSPFWSFHKEAAPDFERALALVLGELEISGFSYPVKKAGPLICL